VPQSEVTWWLLGTGNFSHARPAHSGFHGVSANKKRWKAEIRYDGKNHCPGNSGTRHTKEEAACRRRQQETHKLKAHPLIGPNLAASLARGGGGALGASP
jgi:hypothetical protein